MTTEEIMSIRRGAARMAEAKDPARAEIAALKSRIDELERENAALASELAAGGKSSRRIRIHDQR